MRTLIVSLALLGACGGTKATPAQRPTGAVTVPTPSPPTALTPRDIAQRSGAAIVRIEATGPRGEQIGSGFILDAQGLVATNLHVILGTTAINVKLADGGLFPATEIVNLDPMRDLALLRFAPGKPAPTVHLGDSSKIVAGDQVVAIGNPLGVFENTVSEGLVSSVRTLCTAADVKTENQRCPGELTLLQISAPISQGSSGGPLFNQSGEVIGVTTAINTEGQLINFAMPANYLKPLIAAPAPMSLAAFVIKTKSLDAAAHGGADDGSGGGDGGPAIVRKVPDHPLAVLDGCSGAQLAEVAAAIDRAIQLGAPLYNGGNHEACFRIYENTVTRFERDGGCKGLRTVMGDGLMRASTLSTFKEKAWALRDTFDGFLVVTEKWTRTHGALPTQPAGAAKQP